MKKLRRLLIEQFQSHSYSEFQFSPEFNVIVGPSDQGKSAVIRALKWVYFNEPRGQDFIQAGAREARVTVELEDGTRVVRERASNRNQYRLQVPGGEEQVFTGFGYQQPWEIKKALGVNKVALDQGQWVNLHLAEQLDSPFLLGESGNLRARAMGRLFGVHIIDAALRDVERDRQRAQQEENRLKEQLQEIEKELEQYQDLATWGERLERSEGALARAEKGQAALEQLQGCRRRWQESRRALEGLLSLLKRLKTLDKAAQAWERAGQASGRLSQMRGLRARLEQANSALVWSRGVLDQSRDLSAAETRLREAQLAHERRRELTKMRERSRELEIASNWADQCLDDTRLISRAQAALAEWERRQAELRRLREIRQRRRELETERERQDRRLEEAAASCSELRQRYYQKLQELGRCPLCFNPLTTAELERLTRELEEGEW